MITPHVFWIDGPWPGRLAIAARPRGGDWLNDELAAWSTAGANVVVSLLTSDEIAELQLEAEAQLCQEHHMQYLSFPIADRNVPASRKTTLEFVRRLESFLTNRKTVLIHCRQGIGRSALLGACLLVLSGLAPEAAFQGLSSARGCAVPETEEQRRWVSDFAQAVAPVIARH